MPLRNYRYQPAHPSRSQLQEWLAGYRRRGLTPCTNSRTERSIAWASSPNVLPLTSSTLHGCGNNPRAVLRGGAMAATPRSVTPCSGTSSMVAQRVRRLPSSTVVLSQDPSHGGRRYVEPKIARRPDGDGGDRARGRELRGAPQCSGPDDRG